MNKSLFLIGFIFTVLVVIASYYPVFNQLDKEYDNIPFHKTEDYPKKIDLLIMVVNSDCAISNSLWHNVTMDGMPVCDIAKNYFIILFVFLMIGILIMCVSSVWKNKTIKKQKKDSKMLILY